MSLLFFYPAENLELALNTCSFWYFCVTCPAQATPNWKVYMATNLRNVCSNWFCLERNFRLSNENTKWSLSYKHSQVSTQYCIMGSISIHKAFSLVWKLFSNLSESSFRLLQSKKKILCNWKAMPYTSALYLFHLFFLHSLFSLWERRRIHFSHSNNCILMEF